MIIHWNWAIGGTLLARQPTWISGWDVHSKKRRWDVIFTVRIQVQPPA